MSLSSMVTSDRKDFVNAVKKTVQNTSISSAVMTAASLYFNKKVKDIWYFSAPTNSGNTVEVVTEGAVSSSTDNSAVFSGGEAIDTKVQSMYNDMQKTLTDTAKSIGIGSAKNTKKIPKPQNSVLPEAYFIDMSITYGGQAVSAPIEEGSFTTYNKTNEPFKINATLAFDENKGKGILLKKSVTSIQDTLTKLVELKKSPITFDIITPTREFKNVTLEKFDYKLDMRTGYGVIFVNAVFVEIPEVKVPQLRPIDVKNPKTGGLKPTDLGGKTGTVIDVDKVPQAIITYSENHEIEGATIFGHQINIPPTLQLDW